jgi:hypothetical protein
VRYKTGDSISTSGVLGQVEREDGQSCVEHLCDAVKCSSRQSVDIVNPKSTADPAVHANFGHSWTLSSSFYQRTRTESGSEL